MNARRKYIALKRLRSKEGVTEKGGFIDLSEKQAEILKAKGVVKDKPIDPVKADKATKFKSEIEGDK